MEASGQGQFVLYGLEKCTNVINDILFELDLPDGSEDCFDIRLILTEAITNAFKHGNKGNVEKPIYLRYTYSENCVRFEVEDSGEGLRNAGVPVEVSKESILEDSGRGLFLINAIADKMDFKKNIMVIEKNLGL